MELIKLAAAGILIKQAGYREDLEAYQHKAVRKAVAKIYEKSKKPITQEFIKELERYMDENSAKATLLHEFNYDKWPEAIAGRKEIYPEEAASMRRLIINTILRNGPAAIPLRGKGVAKDLLYVGDDEQTAAHELGHLLSGHLNARKRDKFVNTAANISGFIPLLGLLLPTAIRAPYTINRERQANKKAKEILKAMNREYSRDAANKGVNSYGKSFATEAALYGGVPLAVWAALSLI